MNPIVEAIIAAGIVLVVLAVIGVVLSLVWIAAIGYIGKRMVR